MTNLCHEVISLNALTRDEVEHICSLETKSDKIMKLLVILDRKSNAKEILMKACEVLAMKNGESWFGILQEKIKRSGLPANLARSCSSMI